jgi:serine/threonine-protein kinase
MTAEELLKVVLPILDALRLAHQHGVLHRDLKPSNIFLVASPEQGFVPKLIDFGASKLIDEGGDRLKLTRKGAVVGTPIYMSPEQLRGEPLDARSDIWSLGVVMYRALTGRLPFDTSTFAVLVHKRDPGTAAPPIERRDVPRRLVEVVHRSLAMDREARFPSVAAMLDVLHAPLSLPPGQSPIPPGDDDQTIVDDGGLHDLLQKARRGLPAFIPPIADDLTNVPAENQRMEESVDERSGPQGSGRAPGVRVVAEPTPTPAPHAIRRPPVPVRPARHPGRRPWRGRVRLGLVAAPRSPGDVLRHLEEAISGSWSLRRFASYSTLIDALCEEEVELAWLPPVAYLRARQVGPVHLLLAIERAEGPAYGSALVASQQAGIQSLHEIRGKRVAWVDVWSAAGYLMPRSIIREAGFDPEQVFASQTFVGSHVAVLDAVQQGRADVGATYCSLDEHGALVAAPWTDRPGLRPIALSGAIPGDAICASGEIALADAEAMVEPLIALSAESRGPALMTRVFGAGRFVEVDPSYYQALEGV